MMNRKLKPVVAVVGAAVAASLSFGAMADQSGNPFEAEVLEDVLLADAHGGEGKCGEGEDAEGKCGEGKCGEEGEGGEDEGEAPAEDASEEGN